MDHLDPELRRIISDGMQAAAPGPGVEARGLARLLAALPTAGGPGGGSDPGGAAPIAGKPALATGLKALLVIVGVSVGAIAGAQLAAPARPTPTHATPTREIAAAPPPATLPDPPPSPVFEPAAPSRRTRPVPPPVLAEDPLLAETLALAEADAALARGEHARARELIAALHREHPRGQLMLERTAVDLAARCGQGDPNAGAAAREFLRAHADAAVAAKVRARCAENLP